MYICMYMLNTIVVAAVDERAKFIISIYPDNEKSWYNDIAKP